MLKGFKSKTLLYKLFISYLMIFVVPIVILTGILYKTSVLDVEREIEYSNLHKLRQLDENLNLRMKELEYLALKIGIDERLTPTAMNGTESKRLEAASQLNIYKISNAFAEDLSVYYKGFGKVLSPSGVSDMSTVARYNLMMDEAGQKMFIDYINNLSTPKLWSSKEFSFSRNMPFQILVYGYPLYFQGEGPGAVVIFRIRESSFTKMIDDMLGETPGDVFICSGDGEILMSTMNGEHKYSNDEMRQILGVKTEQIHNMELNGKRHSVISVASDVTGWKLVAAIQTSQLFRKAIYMRTIILQIVISLLTFGVFGAIIIASKNYKPIKKILSLINLQWGRENEESSSDRLNEFDQISRAVEKAISQNRDLKAQIDLQRPFVAEQLLTSLLNGEIRDEKLIENLLRLSKLSLGGPRFTVFVLTKRMDSENRSSYIYKDNVMTALRERFSGDGKLHPVELIHNNAIAFIVNLTEEEMSKEYQRKTAEEIRLIVEAQVNEDIIVGIGKMCDSLAQISRSYIEAMAVLEKSTRSESRVMFFDDEMKEQKQIYWYPAEDQFRLIESLKQGDRAVALATIDTMIGNIAEKGTSTLMIKYVCFDIVNLIIKTINEMNMSEFDSDIEKLMEFSDMSGLEENLRVIAVKFCEYIQQKRNSKDMELYRQILEYVNTNFDNMDLSLEGISSDFRLPVYYLSRFFKEQTGSTFTDYVTKLRMQKARDLLVSTDKTLKEIVGNIGYSDIASFMKRFKKLHGVTPGQYREFHTNGSR